QALSAAGVMSLLEDSARRIWVGTYGGGLCRLDAVTGRFSCYAGGDRVTALAEDRSGRIWAGTDGGGLQIVDSTNGRLFHLRHDPNDAQTLSADTVYSIYVDPRGYVWVGTRGGGLDRVIGSALAPESIRFTNISEPQGLPNDTVYGI